MFQMIYFYNSLHFLKTCWGEPTFQNIKKLQIARTFKQKCFNLLVPHHIESRKFRII